MVVDPVDAADLRSYLRGDALARLGHAPTLDERAADLFALCDALTGFGGASWLWARGEKPEPSALARLDPAIADLEKVYLKSARRAVGSRD